MSRPKLTSSKHTFDRVTLPPGLLFCDWSGRLSIRISGRGETGCKIRAFESTRRINNGDTTNTNWKD
ncbi:hypothetical protein DPEC_G00274420 [Dallia pectoralis]|uniref:Uncharacterized protein n=1 Tax=Dallia pectoralis TaxID=75939 RepID=A0ACC2FL29_DALPE|nr:hypothetical protein DPEC_G00274420 [Dallia pectoralis]